MTSRRCRSWSSLLFRPSGEMADRLVSSPERLAANARPIALGLQRLCEGDLRGMFDGDDDAGPEPRGPRGRARPLGVLRLGALGLVMTCASAWQRAMIADLHERADREGTTARKMINVFDEAWRALAILGVGEWLQASFKLSRRDGVQNVVVMHRLSDLSAAGAAGSRERELAEGLLHDAQTRVDLPPGAGQRRAHAGAARADRGRGRPAARARRRRRAVEGGQPELPRPAPTQSDRDPARRHRRRMLDRSGRWDQ